ncbi:MAG TPA: Stk1 family PASTA domain-containing Ser/Thr kinase [Clostridiaceae bacterium]|nr:Stk1 family PASTA domain-containing Ser/Thr kinase [Clostridiaceae bacterium]
MIGRVLSNRYELVEKLGEGGMAIVYKARCRILNRFVSVKILKKEFSSDVEFLKKFKREATAVASLSDNNIVNVYDVGSDGDINYIVMEYVKGKSLKEILNEKGKLTTDQVLAIAIQIGKALEHAHKNNIVHRDIKPHNVLLTAEGVVKVTDFGIAKSSDTATITNSSKVMGSVHYFSPEQAKGNVVDNRTDIYSMGIVLYELLTGKVPFDAESPVSVALKHIQEPVVPPNQLNENIPDALNKLIMKAIEKEPFRRYQNVTDMVTDLKAIQQNKDLRIVAGEFGQDATRVLDVEEINSKLNQETMQVQTPVEKRSEKSKSGKDKNKKKIMVAAILVLLAVIGAVSGYFAFTRNMAEVAVPAIIGLQQDEAKKLVEDNSLKFVVVGTEKSDEPEGVILKCYPEVGTKVKKNSDVRVSISNGDKVSSIPNVKNMELGAAKEIITDAGFEVGNITYQASTALQKDYIISQSPDSEANSTETTIDLVVSSGTEAKYSTVPDLHGLAVGQASAQLANAGLKLGSTETAVTDNSSLKDTIKSQSIDPGQKVTEGTAISVTYYVYEAPAPAPVPVPVVTQVAVPSITYADGADEQLDAVGLVLGKMTAEKTTDESLDGKVKSMSPPAGTKLDKGAAVDIVYYKFENSKPQGQ